MSEQKPLSREQKVQARILAGLDAQEAEAVQKRQDEADAETAAAKAKAKPAK
jgi:hypothetical protein